MSNTPLLNDSTESAWLQVLFGAVDGVSFAVMYDPETGNLHVVPLAGGGGSGGDSATILAIQTAVTALQQSVLGLQQSQTALTNGSPELLNTLDELSAALGDDPNFATTILAQIAGRAPLVNGRVPEGNLPAHLSVSGLSDSIGQASTADRARVNHTGTQLATTISDFTEAAQDAVAAMLTSGANVILSYDDASNTLQVTAAGGDAEVMRDTIGAALVGVNGVGVTVNDAADTITLSITGVTIAQVTGLQAALDGKPSTTTVQALIDTTVAVKASTLRQLPTVWGKYYNRGAPYAFASRIANFDAQRKRLFVHNIGTVTIQVAPKNTNNLDFNNPATWPTTLAPGEWLITTNTLTHFYRLNVSTDPAAEIHVYTEAVSA